SSPAVTPMPHRIGKAVLHIAVDHHNQEVTVQPGLPALQEGTEHLEHQADMELRDQQVDMEQGINLMEVQIGIPVFSFSTLRPRANSLRQDLQRTSQL
ncbi:MAG: hypothetical protein FWH55_13445, partial [Oscillospiraceae bacterium]|nr:hypothetical protein [Oscillospiraceae bacterium]